MSAVGYAKYYCRLSIATMCGEAAKQTNTCMKCVRDNPKHLKVATELCVFPWVKWICKVAQTDVSYDDMKSQFGTNDALWEGTSKAKSVKLPSVTEMVRTKTLPVCSLNEFGTIPDDVKTAMRKPKQLRA